MTALKELREQIGAAKIILAQHEPESEEFAEYSTTLGIMQGQYDVMMKAAKESGDIDASWDGEGSLDEHRQNALKEIKQTGFGSKSDAAKARKQQAE